jgi:hypothetical protein
MQRLTASEKKSFLVASLCNEAVAHQRQRERGEGYGLDDYTDGRIVGAANLARKILRILNSEEQATQLWGKRDVLV